MDNLKTQTVYTEVDVKERKTLGKILQDARKVIGLKLREVEDATGISNGYLSQLENDKIKQPSANVLYNLSKLYSAEFDTLLYAAGVIKDKPENVGNKLLECLGKITTDEEEALMDFLRYLRFKKK